MERLSEPAILGTLFDVVFSEVAERLAAAVEERCQGSR
jgi:hypothetical protein